MEKWKPRCVVGRLVNGSPVDYHTNPERKKFGRPGSGRTRGKREKSLFRLFHVPLSV